jgi:hypothetical protein
VFPLSIGDDRSVHNPPTPWSEGALVDHPSLGRGRLIVEPDSGWARFIPAGSGVIVAIPVARALSEVRVIEPEEMTDDEVQDFDWESASWSPLADIDHALADELAGLVVGTFFATAGLDHRWRTEAFHQLQLDAGLTPGGIRILRFVLPLGAGESLHEWDGTTPTARAIARDTGDTAGRTIVVERAAGSPCGWEPSDKQPPRSTG